MHGRGAITAAVTTARLIAELEPKRVLFVGAWGAYDDRLAMATSSKSRRPFPPDQPRLTRLAENN